MEYARLALKMYFAMVAHKTACHIFKCFFEMYKFVVVVVLLFYVHGKHQRSCWDCQLT